MKITIQTKTCKFSMEVGPQEPILEIKRKIHHFLAIPIESQALTVCDWELIDGLDLDDYPLISEGTILHLTTPTLPLPPPPPISPKLKLTVKFSTRKIEIEADGNDTVSSLKEKIHIFDGTPMRRMTLCFNGIEMEDDYRELSEYRIEDGSEIVVFLKAVAESAARKVALVVQTSSSLNGARVPVEMKDTSRVDEVRAALVERGVLGADEYIFIHKQRIMREDCNLRWHGVEDGDFLFVFKGSVSRGGDAV